MDERFWLSLSCQGLLFFLAEYKSVLLALWFEQTLLILYFFFYSFVLSFCFFFSFSYGDEFLVIDDQWAFTIPLFFYFGFYFRPSAICSVVPFRLLQVQVFRFVCHVLKCIHVIRIRCRRRRYNISF